MMRTTDFNKTYSELGRRDRKHIDEALDRLRLRVEQAPGEGAAWYGELYLPLKPSCDCKPTEHSIITVLIETKDAKFDDREYVVGDYMIRSSREPLGAPVASVMDLPFEIQRAFEHEAAWLVVDRTWAAVSALVPALADALRPDRAEVDAQSFGAYARRPGSDLPIRLF